MEATGSTKHRAEVRRGDASADLLGAARRAGVVAIDTETSGLDASEAQLRTVQLHVPGFGTEVVQVRDEDPGNRIVSLVEDPAVVKLFHYAVFDLSFLRARFGVQARSVRCTKVAAKLLWPNDVSHHSLAKLSELILGQPMDKTQRMSDWSAFTLTPNQVHYAARDAEVLPDLADRLFMRLESGGLLELAEACWAHLPTRVELELGNYGDVFAY